MHNSDEPGRRFEILVLEHLVRLRAFVRSLGVYADSVDDIAQEALLKAHQDWDSFDQTRDFGKWVRGIAANIVRNEIRKSARRERLLNSDLAAFLLERHSEDWNYKEPLTIEAIRACLAKLRPENKLIVDRTYRDGLKAKDLAKETGKSENNIHQKLSRIRTRVRECILKYLKSRE